MHRFKKGTCNVLNYIYAYINFFLKRNIKYKIRKNVIFTANVLKQQNKSINQWFPVLIDIYFSVKLKIL